MLTLVALLNLGVAETFKIDRVSHVSFPDEQYEVQSIDVRAHATSKGLLAATPSCYEKITENIPPHPLARYNYYGFRSRSPITHTLVDEVYEISGVREALEAAEQAVSDQVPFYCGVDSEVTVNVETKDVDGRTQHFAFGIEEAFFGDDLYATVLEGPELTETSVALGKDIESAPALHVRGYPYAGSVFPDGK